MTNQPDRTDRPIPLVDQAPALTRVAWSTEVVGQTLEALVVYLRGGRARVLRPIHAPALRVGWHPEHQPGDIVVDATRRYDLIPVLAHSTSWRFEGARVILTYVVVVEAPTELNEHLGDEPVVRADLARGDAMAPPTGVELAQVLEHAFRHLSWLVKDDAVVGAALPDWAGFLDGYEPEPFRAFGGSPPA